MSNKRVLLATLACALGGAVQAADVTVTVTVDSDGYVLAQPVLAKANPGDTVKWVMKTLDYEILQVYVPTRAGFTCTKVECKPKVDAAPVRSPYLLDIGLDPKSTKPAPIPLGNVFIVNN